jgi:hypothetical protein
MSKPSNRLILRWTTVALLAGAMLLGGCGELRMFILGHGEPPPELGVREPFSGEPDPDRIDDDPDVPPRPTQLPPNSNFPAISAVLRLGNISNKTLIVRVRNLKPTVAMDCKTVLAKPHLSLARDLFAPATVWQVAPGRAIALNGRHWNDPCGALLIDGSGLTRRLVVWGGLTPVNQPSTTAGSFQERLIALSAGESATEWPNHDAVFPAPFEISPPQPASCLQPDSTVGVAWTTPLPAGDVTLIDVAEAPDGCRMMDLFTDNGVTSWVLCSPPGSFPFKVGDAFFINPLSHGHDLGKLEGVELLGKGFRLRVGRGQETVYFGKGSAKIEAMPGCDLALSECGSRERALQVLVENADGKQVAAHAGSVVLLGTGRTLHVMRARELPIVDTACIETGAHWGRQIESAYVEMK